MKFEKILRRLSGVDNLISMFWCRILIGILFIFYGLIIFFNLTNVLDFWTKISIAIAFFGLGLTFLIDGQSLLRDYFNNNSKTYLKTEKKQSFSIMFAKIFFITGSILFFIKFYSIENPSLYPIVIFLITIIVIIIFHHNISHIKISKEGFEINLGNRTSIIEERIENLENEINELKKTEWNFKITEVNKK
ncbi:MAG: hypothetical protein ACP5NS_00860 [Candidatus Pacearchaeota archaeon]